jgi:hypothetical protein
MAGDSLIGGPAERIPESENKDRSDGYAIRASAESFLSKLFHLRDERQVSEKIQPAFLFCERADFGDSTYKSSNTENYNRVGGLNLPMLFQRKF